MVTEKQSVACVDNDLDSSVLLPSGRIIFAVWKRIGCDWLTFAKTSYGGGFVDELVVDQPLIQYSIARLALGNPNKEG